MTVELHTKVMTTSLSYKDKADERHYASLLSSTYKREVVIQSYDTNHNVFAKQYPFNITIKLIAFNVLNDTIDISIEKGEKTHRCTLPWPSKIFVDENYLTIDDFVFNHCLFKQLSHKQQLFNYVSRATMAEFAKYDTRLGILTDQRELLSLNLRARYARCTSNDIYYPAKHCVVVCHEGVRESCADGCENQKLTIKCVDYSIYGNDGALNHVAVMTDGESEVVEYDNVLQIYNTNYMKYAMHTVRYSQ